MLLSLGVAGTVAVLLLLAGGLLTEVGPWYRALRKPSWQPPDWLFGPAWTLVLALAAWSAALAWEGSATRGDRIAVAALFGINAACHLAWSPLFFKLRRPDWALGEVALLWLSLVALLAWLPLVSGFAAWLIVPYFAWVSFAACLNLAIVRRNRPFPG